MLAAGHCRGWLAPSGSLTIQPPSQLPTHSPQPAARYMSHAAAHWMRMPPPLPLLLAPLLLPAPEESTGMRRTSRNCLLPCCKPSQGAAAVAAAAAAAALVPLAAPAAAELLDPPGVSIRHRKTEAPQAVTAVSGFKSLT